MWISADHLRAAMVANVVSEHFTDIGILG